MAYKTFKWDLGDGTTSYDEIPEHRYARAGTYTWTLEVSYYHDDGSIAEKGTATGTVTITEPDKTAEKYTIRLAIEPQQGIGWSEIDGSSWLDPVNNGAYQIVDDNDTPRCLIEDEDGKIWEDSTFDRVNYIRPTYIDKFESKNLISTIYKWTASGSGTNEYYIQKVDTGNPFLAHPTEIYINATKATEGTIGSLIAGEWGYGNNDGFNTIYVRLDDNSDPDTKTVDYIKAYWYTEIDWEIWFKERVANLQMQEESIEVLENHAFFRPQNPENKGQSNYNDDGYRESQQIDLDVYKDGELSTPYSTITNIPSDGEAVFSGYKIEDRRLQFVLKGSCSDIQITGINHHSIIKPKQLERDKRSSDEMDAETAMADVLLWISRHPLTPLLNRVSGDVLTGDITLVTGMDGYSGSAFLVNAPITLDNDAIAGDYTIMAYSLAVNPINFTGLPAFTSYGTTGIWRINYLIGSGLAANAILASGYVYDLRIYDYDMSSYFSLYDYDCQNKDEPKSFLPFW